MTSTLTPVTENDPLLTPIRVAKLLGVGRQTAYELLNSGDIPSLRIRNSIRVRTSALNKYIADREDINKKATQPRRRA